MRPWHARPNLERLRHSRLAFERLNQSCMAKPQATGACAVKKRAPVARSARVRALKPNPHGQASGDRGMVSQDSDACGKLGHHPCARSSEHRVPVASSASNRARAPRRGQDLVARGKLSQASGGCGTLGQCLGA